MRARSPGTRAQDTTGVEALRRGLALIREAAGPGAIINACGAPILPMIGLADSLRVGADTAFTGVDVDFIMVASAARSLAARAHLWPVVWPDADQAQLRAPLTADEARMSAVPAALASARVLARRRSRPARSRIAARDRARSRDPRSRRRGGAGHARRDHGRARRLGPARPLLENGLLTPPPATFHATGRSGTAYTISVDWTGTHAVTIAP